jgi:hypothetical protein
MKTSKYIKLDHEAIRRDYPEVYARYEGEHMITAVLGTKPDLRKLNENECVIWGDGKTFHFKLTKV